MRSLRATAMLAVAAIAISACADSSTGVPSGVAKSGFNVPAAGFDELGYNDVAGIFNGIADGADGHLDGLVQGAFPEYANDKLVMKWNKAWPEVGGWEMNEWNGAVPGGSGEVWHYMIVRLAAPCGDEGTPLPDGSVCIWGDFAITMSQGTSANEHFWQVHAKPTGYGLSR